MSTLILTILTVLILAGLALWIGERLPFGTETHTLSVRNLPNIAPDIRSGPRDTVAHRQADRQGRHR